MTNKICVYAICKDEIKFLNDWLESMSEADYIVVLDTGSTDGTYEALCADSRVTRVEQQIISPWRFDVARNESMKLIPEDTTICVCTDLDELFDAGWAQILREKWDPNQHHAAQYKYAWQHDEERNPIKIFRYEKIHSYGIYTWVYPIHENLICLKQGLSQDNVLDLYDEIYLHHYMDLTKPRARNYLPLLKLRKEEFPNELATRNYLIQGYVQNGEYLAGLQEIEETLEQFKNEINTEVASSFYLFMGDAAFGLQLFNFAECAYKKAIAVCPEYADQYIALVKLIAPQDRWEEVANILEACLKNASRYYVWFSRDGADEFVIYDYLAVAYSRIGDYDKAFVNIFKALQLKPSNLQLQQNYNFIVNQILLNLKNKTKNSIMEETSPYSV